MVNYYKLYQESVEYLDKHPELLVLDEPLIQKHIKLDKGPAPLQLIIPSKLTIETNEEYRKSKYLTMSVSIKVCKALNIKVFDESIDATNIIIKSREFNKVIDVMKTINFYESIEPLEGIKLKESKRVLKLREQVTGVLSEFLEDQVQDFVKSKNKDYFLNRAVKEVRHDFLEHSIASLGNKAYIDRKTKNRRLNTVVRDLYNLEVQPRTMKSTEDLMRYKYKGNHIGKYAEYFVPIELEV